MSFKKSAITLASMSLFAQIAFATTNTAELNGDSAIQNVTVYASRFGEKQSDSMPQITVITSQEILKSGASNISEVLSKVAGLPTRINLDGSSNAVVDMRGYGETADNNVVVLLDGVRLSEAQQTAARTSMIPLEAVDHIEINKSGNGVLYGDGATSGTINIVTKRNVGNTTVVSGGLSSYKGYQTSFYHSVQKDDTEVSIFGKQVSSNNYRDNSKGSEYSLGTNFIKHVDSQTDLGARFFFGQEKNKLPGALPSIYLNTSPRNTQVPGYNYDADVKTASVTLFGNKRIDNVELTVDFNSRAHSNTDAYSYDAHTVYSGYNNYANWHQSYSNSNSTTITNSFSPRVKISEFLASGNTLLFGYDWLTSRKNGGGAKTDSGYDLVNWPYQIDNSNYDIKHHTGASYVRDTFNISSTDQLVVGYRREGYSQQYTNNLYNDNNLATNSSVSTYTTNGSVTANELQYNKKFRSDLTGYARSSKSFRIANADDNSSSANGNYLYPNWYPTPLQPQTSKDLDAGFNYKTDDQFLAVSYFHSVISNEIGYDPNQGGNVNYDPTKRSGINLREKYALTKVADLRINLQYTRAKFSEGTFTGKTIPSVAPLAGNFSIDYKLTENQQISATTRFSNGKFMSGNFANDMPKTPGYAVEDISYFYKQSNWSLVGTVGNVFKKNYTDTGIYHSSYTDPFKLTVYPNPGRTFTLTGRYNF